MAQITYNKQNGDEFGGTEVTEIKTVVNQNDVNQRNLSKIIPQMYRTNSYILEDGGIGSIGVCMMVALPVNVGDRYHYRSAQVSWGALGRRVYGFYSDLPTSSATFINGGDYLTGSYVEENDIVVPENAKYLVFSQYQTSPIVLSKYVGNSEYLEKSISTSKENLKQNVFNGRNPRRINPDSGLLPLTGTGVKIFGLSAFDGYSVFKSNNSFGEVSTITYDGGDFPLSDFSTVYTGEASEGYIIGFWLYTGNLSGATINLFETPISYDRLKLEGYADSDAFHLVQVESVYGDWSYITAKKGIGSAVINANLGITSGIVSEIKIANPTFIQYYENERLDSNVTYKSKGENLGSKFVGKQLVFFGDSQLTNYQIFQTANILGGIVNVNQDGGRAIKYRTGQDVETDLNWLYHWSRMQYITELKADMYIMHLSTNDAAGGGTLDEASIQAVIDNYPTINDDAGTVTTKIALFNAMDENTRVATFGFKQTYAALIRQLIEYNPETKIVLCTVPLSRASRNTPDDIRNDIYPIFDSINSDIREISEWYKMPLIDVANNVGLNADNAVYYEGDGTHWSTVIQKRIGEYVGKEMLKLNV